MAHRRRGKVTIDMRALRRDRDAALAISRDLVIWHTEENMMMDTVTWWAESKLFDPIPEGQIPPEYQAKVTQHDNGEIAVAWERQ